MLVALAGCAEVSVHQADGTVTVERHFGVVAVQVEPGERSQLIETTGFGVIGSDRQVVLGYHAGQWAMLGSDDCRVVFWIEDEGQLREAQALLADRDDYCTLGDTD